MINEETMKTVIRRYSGKGALELISLLHQQKTDTKSMIGSIPGLISYTVVRTSEGGFTVTLCEDEAGIEESNLRAHDWITRHASHLGTNPPEITHGSVVLYLRK